MTVADWLRTQTYPGTNDLASLARRKADNGVSVSVVIAARNEAATVGAVVAAAATLLPGTALALIDELVVMDGESTDATALVAAAAGARVYGDADVLPEFGPPKGKGDALWRSLAVTSGDLIVFVDGDIANPHPRLVTDLLAPLLATPALAVVKGFYDRPLHANGVLLPAGGGRVTELMARPLLNLYWPQLAGLVQPLSGEYAIRRSLLERLPVFTGYGVELGLLIDTLYMAGPQAVGQVDLAQRVHTNQSLAALSRMSFGILHVAARRLGQASLPSRYVQFDRAADQTVVAYSQDVAPLERPPMFSIAPADCLPGGRQHARTD